MDLGEVVLCCGFLVWVRGAYPGLGGVSQGSRFNGFKLTLVEK